MKLIFKVILWSVLVFVITSEVGAQVQAGVRTMRKVEKIFDQDAPTYEAPKGRPAPAAVKPGPAPSSAPTKWVVAGAKPVNYSKLELKIISGQPHKRIATINNQSFFAGESFRVTVGTNRVEVTCQEIRERSVLVKVAGETEARELKLLAWQ
jgi:hypothetical protein